MTGNLNVLADQAYSIEAAHGFDSEPAEAIALMHSELSEALEELRDERDLTETYYEKRSYGDKPCGVPSEMADVIIRVLGFCSKYGIDIDKAVHEKMAFNANRPYKHGKAF